MIQGQIQTLKIESLLDYSNKFYHDLLGYKPEQTSLEQIPENQWNEFATQKELNPNSSGIYLPRNQTVIIKDLLTYIIKNLKGLKFLALKQHQFQI